MSYTKAWIHYVWSTKNHTPLLTKEIRKVIFPHILENAREKDIWIDTVNGHKEHVHCLVSLGKKQTIAKVAQMIKGESAFWLNKQKLGANKFFWQDDYFAVSICESERVRKYIINQEEHHKKKTYNDEVNEFMQKYGFKYLG